MCTVIRYTNSGGASFFEWGGQRGAKTFLGGQVYMVTNNALPQSGTHTPYDSKFPSLSLDLSFLCFLWILPFHCSFISISCPSIPFFDQARSYFGTRGQLPPPRWMLCPPKRPTCNFLYTLIFHHQCH